MNNVLKHNLINHFFNNIILLNKTDLFYFYFSSIFYFTFFISFTVDEIIDYFYYLWNKDKINFSYKKTIIYRVEDINGIGPYKSKIKLLNNHINTEENPTPYFDLKKEWLYLTYTDNVKNYKFAFKDMKQLNSWFSKEELSLLLKNNFKIVKYESFNTYSTKKQAIFNINESIRIV